MNTIGRFLVLPALMLSAALSGATKNGGVGFRFDDNKTPEEWKKMQAIFLKHSFFCSFAVVNGSLSPEQQKCVKELSGAGFEIMNHTPSHSSQSYTAKTEEEAKALKTQDFVDHVAGRRVFFKYQPNCGKKGKTLKISVKDGKISKFDPARKNDLRSYALLIFPDGRIFGILIQQNERILLDFWGERKNLPPDAENIEVRLTDRNWFDVHPDATRFLAKKADENYKALNLPPPKSFIIPGGWGIFPSAKVINDIYIREFGYKNGDSYHRWGSAYATPASALGRARMSPVWDSLEVKTVAESKKMIADAVATHRVMIFISHMWHHRVKGGFPELLRRNDELLAWLKAKKIPVHTQEEWSDILFGKKADPYENLFPSFACDLNEDRIPDGFEPGKDVSIQKETVTGKGKLFRLVKLTGVERTDNDFSFTVEKAPAGTKITLEYGIYGDYAVARPDKVIRKVITLKGGKETVKDKVPLPGWTNALDITVTAERNVTLGHFEVRKSK